MILQVDSSEIKIEPCTPVLHVKKEPKMDFMHEERRRIEEMMDP